MFRETKIVKLNQRIATALKELCKDENVIWGSSAYGGKRFGFKFTKEWKEKYSDLIQRKDENFESLFSNGSVITEYMKLISASYYISEKFADKLDLSENHIYLLRRSYYDYNEGNTDGDDYEEEMKAYENEAVFIGYKRPFGNSYVIGDVLEAFEIPTEDENGDEIEKDWEEEYESLLNDVIVKIKNFFIACEYTADIEAKYDGHNFEPTNSYHRKLKINKLLNN